MTLGVGPRPVGQYITWLLVAMVPTIIWLTLPPHHNSSALLKRAVEEFNVAFVPGSAFFADGGGQNTLRLSYSLPSEDKITEGIARLGKLLAG